MRSRKGHGIFEFKSVPKIGHRGLTIFTEKIPLESKNLLKLC